LRKLTIIHAINHYKNFKEKKLITKISLKVTSLSADYELNVIKLFMFCKD